jgi:asparagine synthase (glutamine-hydrolysing)
MCGVLGSITNNTLNYDKGVKSMNHRGPDYNNIFTYNNLTLAHSRLSIIDLHTDSNQPFNIGHYTIVFNGEIYNFLELKEILLSEGHKFKTNGDTEVLLLWIINKGIECIDKVDGMFAFALFDEINEELILCRDSLGIKPLYVYQNDHNLIFASEIKSIFALYPKAKKIDKSLIAEYLLNGFIYEPDTGFEKIRKLRPGSYEKYDLKGNLITNNQYWELSEISTEKAIKNSKEINDEIKTSINQHLVSDVPVGLFYSGGIDSSIILTETRSEIAPFTIKSSEEDYKQAGMTSDYNYAVNIAEHLNLNISSIELTNKETTNNDFLKLIEEVAVGNEELMADFTFQSSKLLSQKVRDKGFIVMLSGMGADEIFAGYPRYKFVKYDYLFKIAQPILPLLKGVKYFSKKVDRFNNYFFETDFISRYTSLIGYFSSKEVSLLLGSKSGIDKYKLKLNLILEPVRNLSNLRKAMYLDFYGFLAHNFSVSDKSSMLASIEVRLPLATKRLYEITWGLKDNFLVSLSLLKKPLRNFLIKLVPKKLIDRKKAGFNAPLDLSINKLGKKLIQEAFITNKLFSILDQYQVEHIVNNHFEGKSNNTYKIYQLLHLSYWIKSFNHSE